MPNEEIPDFINWNPPLPEMPPMGLEMAVAMGVAPPRRRRPKPQPEAEIGPAQNLVDDDSAVIKNLLPGAARGEATPDFYIKYSTPDERALRLNNTAVSYKGIPAFVAGLEIDALNLYFSNGKQLRVRFDNAEKYVSTRSYAPGFIRLDECPDKVCYLYRRPGRVYQQGMTRENTYLRVYGDDVEISLAGRSMKDFLKAVENRVHSTPFDPEFNKDLMVRSLINKTPMGSRLNTAFAIATTSHGHGFLMYHQHRLAPLDNNGRVSSHKGLSHLPKCQAEAAEALNIR